MTSTSLFGKAIRYEPGQHAANEAVDTLQARVIANNVAHLADASSQVLSACPPVSSGNGFSQNFPSSGQGLVLLHTYGPWYMRVGPTGRANRVRFRIHGRTTTSSDEVEIFAWLCGSGEGASGAIGAIRRFEGTGNPAVQMVTSTSAAPAWLTPSSGDPLLTATVEETRRARTSLSVRREIGAAHSSIAPVEMQIHVVARRGSGSGATAAELTGFYAAEFSA